MCGGVILDQGVGWVGVIGVAELLSKTTLTEEQREYLNIIRVSGDNLLRIISDILDLSKIETHKLVLERAQFGVRELLTESLSLFQVIAQEKGIKVLDRPHHRDVDCWFTTSIWSPSSIPLCSRAVVVGSGPWCASLGGGRCAALAPSAHKLVRKQPQIHAQVCDRIPCMYLSRARVGNLFQLAHL